MPEPLLLEFLLILRVQPPQSFVLAFEVFCICSVVSLETWAWFQLSPHPLYDVKRFHEAFRNQHCPACFYELPVSKKTRKTCLYRINYPAIVASSLC